jgi:cyclopropane fatty-acyl-phospholipid synthase-like methyltransferase
VTTQYYKHDFWSEENLKYLRPHFRLEKSARIINKLAGPREVELLDVGCGPATLERLLRPNVHYYGIDIALHHPAPNLRESDILEAPIQFGGKVFDIVVAQGLFEYLGEHQSEKFAEIAALLPSDGTFVTTYVNFGHRRRDVYWPYSNVQKIEDFRASLSRAFVVRRWFPTSHNWLHGEPNRRLIKAANMHVNARIPLVSPALAVEYFFICSPRGG